MMNSRTIALVEIGGSHDECLLTQMHALRSGGISILLVTTKEIRERNPAFESYVDEYMEVRMTGSKPEQKKEISNIWRQLKAVNCEKVILNTAQGNLIRVLCWKALFSPMEFIGVIHTTRKFQGSFTQKLINLKVKKYFLLSAYLLSTVKAPRGIRLEYFYPIRFDSKVRDRQGNTKDVVILGGVENRRKDLNGFLDMATQVSDTGVRFVFLGKSDRSKEEVSAFLKEIDERNLGGKIVTFDAFVPQDIFDATVQHAELILPLVHPDTPSADQYFRNQISGAMSVSFGYKIPMLIHEAYEHIEEMHTASFYYNQANFGACLEEALEEATYKKEMMNKDLAYEVAAQEERFLNHVLSK